MRIRDWSSDVCSSDLPRIVAGAADDHVPEVDQAEAGGQLDPAQPLVLHLDAPRPRQIVDGEAGRDGAVVAGNPPQCFDRLDPEAGAVLERAALFVGSPVEVAGEGVGGKKTGRAMHVGKL